MNSPGEIVRSIYECMKSCIYIRPTVISSETVFLILRVCQRALNGKVDLVFIETGSGFVELLHYQNRVNSGNLKTELENNFASLLHFMSPAHTI